jgi:holo-ACP synthase
MSAPVRTAIGAEVSLDQMLDARERRAARQAVALACFREPLVSMTVVMPGPVKDGWLPRWVLDEALRELETMCRARGWPILSREVLWQETGPEALYVVDVDARSLKSATIELEDHHPLGRLWDLDVIARWQGPLSRQRLGFSARRCLVCGQPARVCGRSRQHPLEELLNTIGRIVHEYDLRSAS